MNVESEYFETFVLQSHASSAPVIVLGESEVSWVCCSAALEPPGILKRPHRAPSPKKHLVDKSHPNHRLRNTQRSAIHLQNLSFKALKPKLSLSLSALSLKYKDKLIEYVSKI